MMETMLANWGWIVFSWLSVALASDYYSSLAHIRNAVAHTDDLLKYLDWYADSEIVRIQELRHAVQTMRYSNQQYDVEHPVDAYKLIDRMAHLTKLTDNTQNVNKLKEIVGNRGIPFMLHTDRQGAAMAILRLVRVYNLTIQELLWSPLYGRPATNLETEDMQYIGVQAMNSGDPMMALSWFSAALTMYDPDPELRSEVLGDLAKTHYLFGDTKTAIDTVEHAMYLDPDSNTLADHLTYYENKMAEQEANPATYEAIDWASMQNTGYSGMPQNENGLRYQALCRGDAEVVANQTSYYCHYRKTRYPYIRVREELLSLDPRISILYDVISERDQQALINFALPQLLRSNVGDPSQPELSESRVSKVSWLWDENNEAAELAKRLSEQVSIYTGLYTHYREKYSHAEPFQVNNYGLGGHYEPHYDYYENPSMLLSLPEYLRDTGDRIATYMVYLTDVQAGGATVFPNVNVRVPPVKGAAAFWYNIKRSGVRDDRTLHAGCPVLVGEKWVANKWIREFGQDVSRPCGLSEEAKDW